MSVAITSGLLRRVLVLALGLTSLAKAAVVIDWGAAGVTFTTISATQAVVTGVTTGDAAIPFTATFNTVGSNLALSSGMTGGVFSVPLVNHPAPRNAGTQTTISITLTGYQMSGTSFALLDVDWAGAGASWQDSVTVTSPGAVLTSVNSAFTSVSGNTVLGIGGNVPNSTPNGNVNVAIGSILSAITMTFGAGPVDGFAGGQTIGISNISITSALLDAPEPSTITFIVVGALLMAVGLRIRRRA
jgi:hypothetical protein